MGWKEKKNPLFQLKLKKTKRFSVPSWPWRQSYSRLWRGWVTNTSQKGNRGSCLYAPWPLPWCPWNAPVETYNFLIGCPLPCLGALSLQKQSIQAWVNLLKIIEAKSDVYSDSGCKWLQLKAIWNYTMRCLSKPNCFPSHQNGFFVTRVLQGKWVAPWVIPLSSIVFISFSSLLPLCSI